MGAFLQEFKSRDDIIEQYAGYGHEEQKKAILQDLRGAKIHIAWYGHGDYCGQSLVIYEKDGKLYEVNGSHCSCYGLEGQWEPEETSWQALAMREIYDRCDGYDEANKLLKRLVKKHLVNQ